MGAMSRRRRGLVYAAIAAVVVGAGLVSYVARPDGEASYRPGEGAEGLRRSLARTVPDDAPRLRFTDVAAEAGIDFRHFPAVRSGVITEDMGSGAAWGDFDGDGDPDLYLVNWVESGEESGIASGNRLFRNNGDASFTDISEGSGVDWIGPGSAAAWGDLDGDGRLDLWTTSIGRLHFYRNLGGGLFEDESQEAGIVDFEGFWTGVSLGDYDRDGDLDVYISGYLQYDPAVAEGYSRQYEVEQPASLNPSSFQPQHNLLFKNDGHGRFEEVGVLAGVDDPSGRSLSAAWADFDQDGWLDLYVANDVSDNALLLNRGDGTFENVSLRTGVADYRGAMGLAVSDWDGDGDLDLFITHWIAQENAFFENLVVHSSSHDYGLRFTDVADRTGLGQSSLDFVGWATSFVDFDKDGRDDLFVLNGSTFQKSGAPEFLVPMADLIYWNGGRQRGFFPLIETGLETEAVGRGGAAADFDGDGDVDLLVVDHGGQARLLRNDSAVRNGWIRVTLQGPPGNTAGLGAKVVVHVAGRVQTRQIGAQSSYLSQNDASQIFGLGDASLADSVVITWVTGQRTVKRDVRSTTALVVPFEKSGADSRRETMDFWADFRAATRHRMESRPAEAATAYRRALASRPDHEDGLYYLGAMAYVLGDEEQADSAWARLAQINSRAPRALMQLGSMRLCRPESDYYDPEAARDFFAAALSENRTATGPMMSLGYASLALRDEANAARWFETVLQSDPENRSAWVWSVYLTGPETGLPTSGQLSTHRAPEKMESGLGEGDTESGRAMTAGQGRCAPFSLSESDLEADSRTLRDILRDRLEGLGPPGR